MPKLVKYLLYLLFFAFSFVLFLYWSLPYDALKERIVGGIEKQIGADYQIEVEEFSPYWFTGLNVSGVEILSADAGKNNGLIKFKSVKGRASIFSLLFGSPKVSFDLELGKGGVSGSVKQNEDDIEIDIDLDDVDLKEFGFITKKTGLNLSSRIDGSVRMKINKQRFDRSEGKIELDLDNIKLKGGTIKIAEMEIPLPDLVFTKGSGSEIKLDVGKGQIQVKNLKIKGGDLELELSGKIFLSNNINNCRMNLKGSFRVSEKLEKAMPFLFIVDKQKNDDGSFPLSFKNRLGSPTLEIGSFKTKL